MEDDACEQVNNLFALTEPVEEKSSEETSGRKRTLQMEIACIFFACVWKCFFPQKSEDGKRICLGICECLWGGAIRMLSNLFKNYCVKLYKSKVRTHDAGMVYKAVAS